MTSPLKFASQETNQFEIHMPSSDNFDEDFIQTITTEHMVEIVPSQYAMEDKKPHFKSDLTLQFLETATSLPFHTIAGDIVSWENVTACSISEPLSPLHIPSEESLTVTIQEKEPEPILSSRKRKAPEKFCDTMVDLKVKDKSKKIKKLV